MQHETPPDERTQKREPTLYAGCNQKKYRAKLDLITAKAALPLEEILAIHDFSPRCRRHCGLDLQFERHELQACMEEEGGGRRTVVVSPESLSLKVEERRTKKEER